MRHLQILFMLALLCGCATSSTSTEMNERSLSDVTRVAEKGDREAMHDLCYRYIYGLKATKNYAEALAWCSRAAVLGVDSSQVLLAELFLNGHGVQRDYSKALIWYQAAAEQGHRHALLMLYYIYADGRGVAPDLQKALAYLRQSANDGYQAAIDELARREALPSRQ